MKIDAVREFLLAVLRGDADVTARIAAGPDDARFEDGCFVFSPAALHRLLDAGGDTDPKRFRQMLYASTLNRDLRAQGAEIAVFLDTGKVRSNLYCLKAT